MIGHFQHKINQPLLNKPYKRVQIRILIRRFQQFISSILRPFLIFYNINIFSEILYVSESILITKKLNCLFEIFNCIFFVFLVSFFSILYLKYLQCYSFFSYSLLLQNTLQHSLHRLLIHILHI